MPSHKGPRFKSDDRIRQCLRELQELSSYEASAHGDAVGKNAAAERALRNASEVVRLTAGWALDHYRGLAVRDLRPDSQGAQERSELLDSHVYEEASQRLNTNELEPVQGRRFLRNLLLTVGYNLNVPDDLTQSIEALDFGQMLPALQPQTTADRLGLTARRARLTAIAYVEYEYQKTGTKKEYIWEQVANLFATNRLSMKDWRAELRDVLGKELVNEFISKAREAGKSYRKHSGDSEIEYVMREMYEDDYGMKALVQAAEVHKRRSP